MRILITGGFGFIGGNLISKLYLEHELIISTRKKNIPEDFLIFPNLSIINHEDLLIDSKFPNNIDVLIHLANMNSIDCEKNPIEAIDFNVNNSLYIFQNAIKKNVPHIIYFSTIQVYGSELSGIINENTLTKPDNIYSITHKAAEDILNYYCSNNKDSKYSIIRLSNSFGAPVDKNTNIWHSFINNICYDICRTKEIIIKSKFNIYKDFIAIREVVKCVDFLIHNKFNNAVYNLSSEKTVSLLEMSRLIKIQAEKLFINSQISVIKNFNDNSNDNHFNIINDNLNKINFQISDSIDEEIESLILFCKNSTLN
jgi:UDP-glucose 4-epimerase